jgi:hypothetical protein
MAKKRGKRRGGKKLDKKEGLKEKTLEKIDIFSKELASQNLEEASIEFFNTVREFLESFFNIRYEFTYNELNHEIEKKKIVKGDLKKKLVSFSNELSLKEYSDKGISKDELLRLISSFRNIVIELTSAATSENGGVSGAERIRTPLLRIRWMFNKFLPNLEKRGVKQIYKLLIKADNAVKNNDLATAKNFYRGIIWRYRISTIGERKKLYPRIGRIYKNISQLELDSELRRIDHLLSKGYRLTDSNQQEEAKEIYAELNNIYTELPQKEKRRLYPELARFYKQISKVEIVTNIERLNELMDKINSLLESNRTGKAKRLYVKAKEIYESLPEEEKKRAYKEMEYLYNLISLD